MHQLGAVLGTDGLNDNEVLRADDGDEENAVADGRWIWSRMTSG
jgi:hypothetical protein